MTAETEKNATRAHEHEFTIDASPADVWKAITQAEELIRWFPMEAQVKPGAGGLITYGWAPEMQNPCEIEVWEPEAHLRTSWMEPVAGDADGKTVASVVDWFIEGEGGRTTLRLVHSGFKTGTEWDDEYDGTKRGWNYEVRSLKHYLENHAGTQRRMIALRQPVSISPGEMWQRLLGPDGLAPRGGADSLTAGGPYEFNSRRGDKFKGSVLVAGAPRDFAGTVAGMNNAILRIAYETCFGRPEAFLFISTWGVDEKENKKLEGRLHAMLQQLFA
jgi:uncharacterized protein YndB with AHSA1/START domain